jgi:hypothetical protein
MSNNHVAAWTSGDSVFVNSYYIQDCMDSIATTPWVVYSKLQYHTPDNSILNSPASITEVLNPSRLFVTYAVIDTLPYPFPDGQMLAGTQVVHVKWAVDLNTEPTDSCALRIIPLAPDPPCEGGGPCEQTLIPALPVIGAFTDSSLSGGTYGARLLYQSRYPNQIEGLGLVGYQQNPLDTSTFFFSEGCLPSMPSHATAGDMAAAFLKSDHTHGWMRNIQISSNALNKRRSATFRKVYAIDDGDSEIAVGKVFFEIISPYVSRGMTFAGIRAGTSVFRLEHGGTPQTGAGLRLRFHRLTRPLTLNYSFHDSKGDLLVVSSKTIEAQEGVVMHAEIGLGRVPSAAASIGFTFEMDGVALNQCSEYTIMDQVAAAVEPKIHRRSSHEIDVYPNPAADAIAISGISMGDVVQVFNSLGLHMPGQAVATSGTLYLDVRGYRTGVYHVVCATPGGPVRSSSFVVKRTLKAGGY